MAIATAVVLLAAPTGTPRAWAAPAPDGPRLAFIALSSLQPRGFSVQTVGPDGRGRLVLQRGSTRGVTPVPGTRVSWSPDGTWLLFSGWKGPRRGIYKLRADGSGLRFLRGTEGGRNPLLSPDGTRLAFTRDRLPDDLFVDVLSAWVADADGRHAQQLTPWHARTEAIPTSFAPDNSRLALTKVDPYSGKSNVLLIRPDRTARVELLVKRASDAVFSPDGSRLALVRHKMSTTTPRFVVNKDLHLMDPNGTSSTPLTKTPKTAETHPSWDPSGQRLSFNAYRNSKDAFDALFNDLLPLSNSIVQINADGTCRQKILKVKEVALRGGTWQPGPDRVPGPIAC